jgi:hypothetical protein
MTPGEVRAQFLAFCGTQRFRKFAASLFRRSDIPATFERLRFWQETLWEQFVLRCPDAPTDVNEIGLCVHWCDLHDNALEAGSGHQPRDLRYSTLFEAAREREFPHGYGWLGHHCPACKAACIAWINSHPSECRMLQHLMRSATWVSLHRNDPEFRKLCQNEFLPWDEIIPGDEVWMIDTGRGPPRPALVREGFVVPLAD